jgi:hypothetical protein
VLSYFQRLWRSPRCLAADLPGPRLAQTLEQGLGDRTAAALFFCPLRGRDPLAGAVHAAGRILNAFKRNPLNRMPAAKQSSQALSDDCPPEEMLAEADKAVYRSKLAEGNAPKIYRHKRVAPQNRRMVR